MVPQLHNYTLAKWKYERMLSKKCNVLNVDLKKPNWKKKNSMEDILAKKTALKSMFYFFPGSIREFFKTAEK